MSTFREIVYMVLDHSKLSNDDSYIEPEHVLYIVSKLRAYLLSSKYQKIAAQISNSNFQTIDLTLEPFENVCGCDNSGMWIMRSIEEIPNVLLLNNYEGLTVINPSVSFGCSSNFNFVNPTRFNAVGYNKWLKNQQYATIGPDNHLYIKSADSNVMELEMLQISAVFEDAEKAAKLIANNNQYDECLNEDSICDVMDAKFPLEEGLITLLIDNASQFIYQMSMKSRDVKNSSNDELGNIINYLNTLLKEKYKNNSQKVQDD